MRKTTLIAWIGTLAMALAVPSVAAQNQRGEDASTRNANLKRYLNPGFHRSFIKRLENGSPHPGLRGSGGGGDASSSTASNFGGGSSISVNPRTGGVSLEVQLFNIHGVHEEIELSFALTYQSEDAISDLESGDPLAFGLPPGWSMSLSYLEPTGYLSVNIDGNQQYVYDPAWRTAFLPKGATTPLLVATGLKQLNRADAKLQLYDGPVSVGGVPAALVFAALDGKTRYLSGNGLLLLESDRFGNTIEYHYANDVIATSARLERIVDSWSNEVLFETCVAGFDAAGEPCAQDGTTITLPDGRQVGWREETLGGIERVTEIFDAEGKVTPLAWEGGVCGGYTMLENVTSAAGGSTTVQYQCMAICADGSCNSTKSWPVAMFRFDCPDYTSGGSCPSGDNFLTTHFDIGGTPNSSQQGNYTGYPLYSPYPPPDTSVDPAADSLMRSNDATFQYTTAVVQRNTSNQDELSTERTYNFLHLEQQQVHRVRDPDTSQLVAAKATANCYDLTGEGSSPGCSSTGVVNYTRLPANYQSATITGSCVFAVGDEVSGGARLSIATREYDSFGNIVNRRAYHGTTATGVVANCDRATLLNPTPLSLVMDSYLEYDTPTDIVDGYLPLGVGVGRFGLLLGAQSYLYPDPNDEGTADVGTPVQATLACNSLTDDSGAETLGAAVKSTLFGSIPVGASKPAQPGVVAACGSPQWDESIAPPKLTSYTYDDAGRVVAIATEWAGATAGDQPGIEATGTDLTFELTSALPSEEVCGLVLQKTATDVQGHSTESRVCVQNSFPLSKADQEGRRVFYEHADSGLTTRVTDPNGSFKTFDYYYACPDGPDGSPTCPSGFANLGSCPYGDSSTARSCTVQTQYAGTNPTSGEANESFVDGLIGVDIKDGLGRTVQTLDNLGADDSFSAYAAIQTRSRSVFDDRNLVVEQTKEVGALSPLVYTTTTEFGPKQRPQLSCDPRGVSHEFVRDDVGQHVKRTFNGHQVSRISSNDGHKVTRIMDCPIVGETTVSAGACPVATASTSSAMCTGDVFLTDIARDGAGNQRGITASAASAEASGASIASVSAETRYGADLVKYDFEIEGTATSTGQSVHAETSWTKDLRGSMLSSDITVDGVSTSQFASTRFEADELGNQIAQISPLSGSLMESNLFTPSRQLASHTDFAGSEFQTFYDDMNRPFRHCYPDGDGGFEGERFTRDAITGAVTSVVHFQNASACDACESGDCGDVDTSMVGYTYTRFGQVLLKVYVDALQSAEPRTTFLQWGYDEYQRPICFADAAATILGSRCPPSPVPSDWVPEPEEQLAYLRYWEDSDPHRRGLLKSACRGVAHREEGAIVYETQCFDQDYYTSLDSEGSCDGVEAQGAYASLLKSSMLCRGGSCLEGSGQEVYTSIHLYDAHRRECSVTMRDPEDRIILDSRYAYDHFDNVITETHASDLDASDGSNYSVTYAYDGLLRLIGSDRSDSDGSAIESYEYEYDAASNITKKVKTTYE